MTKQSINQPLWSILIMSLLIAFASFAYAVIDTYEFDNQEQEARFHHLIKELRCPKCQNASISDSNAELAKDLRLKTYTMIMEGRSDAEIMKFMTDRYGDFITYRPPLKPVTWILWFAPFTIGILALVWLLFYKSRKKNKKAVQSLTSEEQAEIERLLQDEQDKNTQ